MGGKPLFITTKSLCPPLAAFCLPASFPERDLLSA